MSAFFKRVTSAIQWKKTLSNVDSAAIWMAECSWMDSPILFHWIHESVRFLHETSDILRNQDKAFLYLKPS